jgi:hypothetical protein
MLGRREPVGRGLRGGGRLSCRGNTATILTEKTVRFCRTSRLLYASAGTLQNRADLSLPRAYNIARTCRYAESHNVIARPLDTADWGRFRENMSHSEFRRAGMLPQG